MEEITTKELVALRKKDILHTLLDCRGPDYFRWEHIPSAINLRWKYIEEKAADLLPDRHALVITSCDGFTCSASSKAFKALWQLGYNHLLEYSGGLADWKAHGHQTQSDSQYKIAPHVYAFPNQTFFGEQIHSYLIDNPNSLLLIDGPQQLTEEHEDFILGFGKPIDVLLTHGSTAGEAARLQEQHEARIWMHPADKDNPWLTVKPTHWLSERDTFGDTIQVIHTPGHSPGSVCFWYPQAQLFFTGDHITGSGAGISDFLNDAHGVGSKEERLASAQKLLSLSFNVILPFHQKQIRQHAKEALADFIVGVKGR